MSFSEMDFFFLLVFGSIANYGNLKWNDNNFLHDVLKLTLYFIISVVHGGQWSR